MVSKEDEKSVANELETKIIQQIEYYFGDINLSKDKFLKEQMSHENGWVPLETLLTFNRLKSLSDDKNFVVNALKKSTNGLIEISECGNKIRRRTERPVPEFTDEYKTALNERTVHVKGFPPNTQLDDVMNFCKQFGTIENIEMRKYFKTKQFKGCIFVVFSTKEEADKLINAEEVKYKENNLLRENKTNYLKRKQEYSDSRKNKRNSSNNKTVVKPDFEAKEEPIDEEEKPKQVSTAIKAHNPVNCEGAILKLKGIDKDTNFLDIKKVFLQHGKVAYVESVNDNLESFVRFAEKDGAKTALEKAKIMSDDETEVIKVEINGKDIIAEVLTGDEEREYWNAYEWNRSKNINLKNQKKGRGSQGKGRKGKNMWQRKRPYKGDSESKKAKQFKTDSD